MVKLKFNDYIAPQMKKNVIAGYNWCKENNTHFCKVNTMTVSFDFMLQTVRILSQGYSLNYKYEEVKK